MAEPSWPSKKRKASLISDVAATPGSEVPSLKKSSDFWIDDGNFVLRTATKQYRIHQGVLSMHSSVFRDMFSIPQPAEQQTVENAPIIEVTDSADDWDLLLPIIYGMRSMYVPDTTVIPPSLMVSMLRLGGKYDLERFKREAFKQLETLFPDSLAEWDRLFDDSLQKLQRIMEGSVVELVHTVMELNIRRALPCGFFTCLRERTMDEILSGVDKMNGPVFLARETQNKLVLGKEALIRVAADKAMAWFLNGSVSGTCLSPKVCGDEIQEILKEMASDPGADYALVPPVGLHNGLCSQCSEQANKKHLAGRQETFRLLPSYFGLEPWDQLTNDF